MAPTPRDSLHDRLGALFRHRDASAAATARAPTALSPVLDAARPRRDRRTASPQRDLFSHNRFNLLSFHDRDHGDGSGDAAAPAGRAHARGPGIAFDGGPIRLLCMPRMLGYAFNPISVYFCHQPDGVSAAIVYEVHNTFGERHSYVFDARDDAASRMPHACGKRFHVSPFMDMDMRYEFRTVPPGERVAVAIKGSDADGTLIHASLAGVAAPFTSANLLRGLLLYPLMTFKVTAAIHWHALRLWLKGIRIRPKPAAAGRTHDPDLECSEAMTGNSELSHADARKRRVKRLVGAVHGPRRSADRRRPADRASCRQAAASNEWAQRPVPRSRSSSIAGARSRGLPSAAKSASPVLISTATGRRPIWSRCSSSSSSTKPCCRSSRTSFRAWSPVCAMARARTRSAAAGATSPSTTISATTSTGHGSTRA